MDFADVGGADPRQALALALRDSLIPQTEDGAFVAGFDIIMLDQPSIEALCEVADGSLARGEDLLVAIFSTSESCSCLGLALIRHEGKVSHLHLVEPYVADVGERMLMVWRQGQRAFVVNGDGAIMEVPMPALGAGSAGIAQGWIQLRVLMKHGKPDPRLPSLPSD